MQIAKSKALARKKIQGKEQRDSGGELVRIFIKQFVGGSQKDPPLRPKTEKGGSLRWSRWNNDPCVSRWELLRAQWD